MGVYVKKGGAILPFLLQFFLGMVFTMPNLVYQILFLICTIYTL